MSKVRPRTKLVAIHPVHGYAIPPPQDVKVSRRNARERNRVKSVNNGFEMLKRHVPSAAPVKKMSKVNILTQAVEYIESLQSLLDDVPSQPSKPVPLTGFPPSGGYQETQTYQTYPGPPLTPISPNTMFSPCYPPPPPPFTPRHYESGYDSSQEQFQEHQHQHQHHHQYQHHQQQYNKVSPLSPPDSSVSATSPGPGYLVAGQVQAREESSGEEDDILDAIAEWQQQD